MERRVHAELMAIRKIRKKKKMSQQEVAESADCHQSYYSKVERGNANPTFSELKDIAKALNTTVKKMIGN